MSYHDVVDFIEGHWSKIPDAKATKLREWLERRKVREDDVMAALESLIDDGLDFTPKTAQIAKKLKAMGAILPPPLGVGDREVVGHMKFDIAEGLDDTVALLSRWSRSERLQAEYDQAQAYAAEDRELGLGSEAYWRDRLQAFRELLNADVGVIT